MTSTKIPPENSTIDPITGEAVDPATRAKREVDNLDFECRIGEEPWEMETSVHILGREIGELFAAHMKMNPPPFMPPAATPNPEDEDSLIKDPEMHHSVYIMHMEILFNFIYLVCDGRNRSITRYSERLLEQMLVESSQELNNTELLQFPIFYALFEEAFKFLEQLGIKVNAPLPIKQLRAIQRRMSACDTNQFACH
jgi:hypothetical protein